MRIFRLSTDKAIIGNYPQLEYDKEVMVKDSYILADKILFKDLDEKIILYPIKTTHQSKLTDIMSTSFLNFPFQFICSDRLLALFTKYSGITISSTKINIKRKGKHIEYNLVNIMKRLDNMPILFSKHTARYESGEQYMEQIPVKSQKMYEANKELRPINLPLDNNLTKDLEFFVMPFANLLLVSNAFAADIISNQITGIQLLSFSDNDDVSMYGIDKLDSYYHR